MLYFAQHAPLRPGKLKGQYFFHARQKPRGTRDKADAPFMAPRAFAPRQTELQIKKLVENNRAMRRRRKLIQCTDGRIGRRHVQARQRGVDREQAMTLGDCRGQMVRDRVAVFAQRLRHPATHQGQRNAGRANIDRQNPLQLPVVARIDQLKIRVRDAQPPGHPLLDLAVNQKILAVREAVCEKAGRAIPDQIDAAAVVSKCRQKHLAPQPRHISFLQGHQASDKARFLARHRLSDFFYFPAVVVTERQVMEQIPDCFEAERF